MMTTLNARAIHLEAGILFKIFSNGVKYIGVIAILRRVSTEIGVEKDLSFEDARLLKAQCCTMLAKYDLSPNLCKYFSFFNPAVHNVLTSSSILTLSPQSCTELPQ